MPSPLARDPRIIGKGERQELPSFDVAILVAFWIELASASPFGANCFSAFVCFIWETQTHSTINHITQRRQQHYEKETRSTQRDLDGRLSRPQGQISADNLAKCDRDRQQFQPIPQKIAIDHPLSGAEATLARGLMRRAVEGTI